MSLHVLTSALPRDLAQGSPFDRDMAADCGVGRHELQAFLEAGDIRRMLTGVYVAAAAPDDLATRLAAINLVTAPSAFIVDGSAAWLHAGDSVLAPGEHLQLNEPTVFDERRGCRLRRKGLASGTRDLLPTDVMEIGGVRVTTPLRTALDVARLHHPQRGLATVDGLLRETDLTKEEMVAELPRFRGARWITRGRLIVTWADGRSQSYGESASRLAWLTTPGLPPPQLQVPVEVDGHTFYLDLADEDLMIGVEYDGERWHGPDRADHDDARRKLIRMLGWVLLILRRADVFGEHRQADQLLAGIFRERRADLRR